MFGSKYRAVVKQVGELQLFINGLIGEIEEIKGTYRGNPYTTYKSMVDELSKKAEGTANWGNQLTQNIIAIRSAFIMGSGIKFGMKDKANKKEFDFVKELFDFNDLDEENPIEFCKESEIEGKFLCKLSPNKEKQQIEIRHISYTQSGYKVLTEEDDYKHYTQVKYKYTKPDGSQSEEKTLEEKEFVYKRFGGRLNKVNDTPPKLGAALRNIEDLDKALWDLRKINHLFASPTPTFKCTEKNEADKLYDRLKKINWKIGKLLVSTAEYKLEGYTGSGVEYLLKEIEAQVKMVSGTTGVPVHFLGLPDLLSNRATAENMMEMLYASTSKERKTWIGAYEEIINKAMLMANVNFNQNYITGTIKIEIPFITAEKMKELAEVWLPLYSGGVISLKTMLSKVPEVDPEEEMKANELNETEVVLKKDEEEENAIPE